MKKLLLLSALATFFWSCKTQQAVQEAMTEEIIEDLINEDEVSIVSSDKKGRFQAEETKLFDLIHTRLEVSFDWDKQYLNGEARLLLSPYAKPQNQLMLDAKGFDIHQISMIGSQASTSLKYSYDNAFINIELGATYQRKDTIEVLIKYTAKPNELEAGGSEAITEDKGLYFINPLNDEVGKPQQIWTQGETEASSCWFPTIDAPNQRSTQELLITVQDRFTTLSNGELIYSTIDGDYRTDYWRMEKPHAPYLFMMAIGEFAVVEQSNGDVPLSYYVEPKFEKYAKDIFGNTAEMLEFLETKLDYPYPWNKYAQVVVRDYVSGAMENTTASTFMEEIQVDTRSLIDYNWDYIIMHEAMHQWFGDLVTCESWSNLPLNEAFANYSEYLWNEHKYGLEEADYNGKVELDGYLEEAKGKRVELIRYHYDDKEDMFDAHSYNKGGRVLHMLRRYLGDDVFFGGLSYYLKRNAYQSVEVHDLRLAFEHVSGEDLNWFFDQWFLAAGHPELEFSHKYIDGVLHATVKQVQDIDLYPVFQIPTQVAIVVDGQVARHDVLIDQAEQSFQFVIDQKPELVVLDPDRILLAELKHSKSKEALELQYRYFSSYVLRYEALSALEDLDEGMALEIFTEALEDSFWATREQALNFFESRPDDQTAVLPKLFQMADKDENSNVQSAAISILSDVDFADKADFFRKHIYDSSYSVASSALYGILQTDDKSIPEILKTFEKEENINLVVPVADYFISNKRYDKFDWLNDKLKSSQGTDTYYLLQFMGNMIVDAPEETQIKSIPTLTKLGSKHSKYYVRYAATRFLGMLEHIEGVKEKLSEIEKNEKDERLREMYENNR